MRNGRSKHANCYENVTNQLPGTCHRSSSPLLGTHRLSIIPPIKTVQFIEKPHGSRANRPGLTSAPGRERLLNATYVVTRLRQAQRSHATNRPGRNGSASFDAWVVVSSHGARVEGPNKYTAPSNPGRLQILEPARIALPYTAGLVAQARHQLVRQLVGHVVPD